MRFRLLLTELAAFDPEPASSKVANLKRPVQQVLLSQADQAQAPPLVPDLRRLRAPAAEGASGQGRGRRGHRRAR